jgi:tyrosyl-tRNA synthetase
LNIDDAGVEGYLKVYTELSKAEIDAIIKQHSAHPKQRYAQLRLAHEVTQIVHGTDTRDLAEDVTYFITGSLDIKEASETQLSVIRDELASAVVSADTSVVDALCESGLASSKTEARRLVAGGSVYVNGVSQQTETFHEKDFRNNRLLLRKGKTLKNTALIELASNK